MPHPAAEKRPDYGLDAPGLIRTFFLVSAVALACFLPMAFGFWPSRLWGFLLTGLLILVAIYAGSMGCLMIFYSRVTKLKERERLLDLISLSGNERILDVGCGRGLLTVGAAKRLPNGKAIGIDIWQAEDQSNNRPDAAFENARLEGVSERVEIQTADMRQLPFADQSFDAIVSHWAVHNLYNVSDRIAALAEMHRVTKLGGWVILADIEHLSEYAEGFAKLGFIDIQHVRKSWKTAFLFAISFGSFSPTAVLARKQTNG